MRRVIPRVTRRLPETGFTQRILDNRETDLLFTYRLILIRSALRYIVKSYFFFLLFDNKRIYTLGSVPNN